MSIFKDNIKKTPFFFSFILILFCQPQLTYSADLTEAQSLIKNGSFILARKDQNPLQYNDQILQIPASILKIATAAAALSLLGPDYRFRTEFYQTTSGDIIIKGWGDPFLISEEIDLISKDLSDQIANPSRIIIDQSAFDLKDKADGTSGSLNPYDAGNAALAVNFNTINIKVTEDLEVASAEPQTPTLPIMQTFGREAGPGEHRLNISGLENSSNLYAGQLFASLIARNNNLPSIPEIGSIQNDGEESSPELVYIHYSTKKLTEVVKAMLLYSNNFIANQIFLTCGASKYGYPATWSKGKEALDWFLNQEIGLPAESFRIREGSGISRENLLTAGAMLKILENFRPYARLLPDYQGHFIKSGTMTGIYNYAGFVKRKEELQPLVIILNQEENLRDRLLGLLVHAEF